MRPDARDRRALLAGAAAAAVLPARLRAQPRFPSSTVRLIVPFPAGGSTDLAARQLTQNLSSQLGQPAVVENRAGADGAIAAVEVARAAPDGHTLFMATSTSLSFVPATRRNPGYSLADFAPIAHLGSYIFYLVVHESVPGKNLEEILAYARANPGKVTYGSGNSTGIVGMAYLLESSRTEMVHVPYKGEAQAVLDLSAGRIQMMLITPAVLAQATKDGRARPVCVILNRRSPLMPDVPTIEEAGQPLMPVALWAGFLAPARTPPSIVEQLAGALRAAVAQGDMRERLEKVGIVTRDPQEDFGAFLRAQTVAWRKAVELAKIPIEG